MSALSRGRIRLVIGGKTISADDSPDEYGISEAALALLRTLESDHSIDKPVVEERDTLIEHLPDGALRRSDVVSCEEIGAYLHFPDLMVELPASDYRREVVAFAQPAKQLFTGIDKQIYDDYDREQYEAFWSEYDAQLARAASAAVRRRTGTAGLGVSGGSCLTNRALDNQSREDLLPAA